MNSQGDVTSGNDGQRLNGWKEIAAHLGKSVRTVQRWEREYQLPIRRIGRDGGEIVFAFQNEIDAWSARNGRLRESDREPETVVVQIQTRRYRRLTAAIVLALVASGAAYFTTARDPLVTGQAVAARIQYRTLVALSESGRQLWSRELDFEPSASAYLNFVDEAFGMKPIRVVDLDKDGTNEIVMWIVPVGVKGLQGYRVFNSDGTLRYAMEPSDRVIFGSEEFVGPWTVFRMFVLDNPDGSRSIWTAFIHSLWFPTLLLEVDSAGRIKSRYWSNGYIEQVEVARLGDRWRVAVAATHNDTRGASLALFDYGKVAGSAPATQSRFQCRTCASGGPDVFLVLPRQCIAEAFAGQAAAQQIKFDDRGRVFLFAGEGPRNAGGDFGAGIWYTIEPEIEKSSFQLAVSSAFLHNRLENEGRLNHPFSSPVHLSHPVKIMKWAGAEFTSITVRNLTPTNVAPRAKP